MLHVVLSPDVSSNLFRQYLFPELPLYGILTGQKHFSIAILKLIYTLVPDYCVDLGLHYLPSKYFVNAVANWIGYTLLTY